MIPLDLKLGAILRCVRGSTGGGVVAGQTYVLKGYNQNPFWSPRSASVLLAGTPNTWSSKDSCWMLDRFELVCDGDGSDYQPPDDVDLQMEARL
jgi:hypothetical protein